VFCLLFDSSHIFTLATYSYLTNFIKIMIHIYTVNFSFRSGNYGTKFIPEQYPDGFSGRGKGKGEERCVVFICGVCVCGVCVCAGGVWG
jgi:hypothetical protein